MKMFLTCSLAMLSLGLFAHDHSAITPQGKNGNTEVPACALNAWSPEIFTFYGDAKAVTGKIETINRNLKNHRTFAFVVESSQGSSLYLYEGETLEASQMALGQAQATSFRALTTQISNGLLRNSGEKCSGMLAKEMIQAETNNMTFNTVSKPGDMAAAFKALNALAGNEYVRVTFILLC